MVSASLAQRRRRIGVMACALSVLGLPCAASAVWGVRMVARSSGEWAILGWIIGGFAVLVGAPGTFLAIQRLRLGLALLRDRPDASARATRLAEATIAMHLVLWAVVAWLASYLRRADLSFWLFAALFGALALSASMVGHALAARSLARDAEAAATSSRPSPPPSARSL